MIDQAKMPLYEALLLHKKRKPSSFHVPGHKSGFLYKTLDIDPTFYQFLTYDVTELSGLDDLFAPKGAIAEAQTLLTTYYETRASFFLVNGTTVGNLTMVLAVCSPGDVIFVQRNCHQSIIHACMLAKVKPVFLSPEMDNEFGVPNQIDLRVVKEAFKRYPQAKACVFTYPNYYGMTYQLKQIIEYAHENNLVVLVDEAHGPHFKLGEPFPPSAIDLGADIIVQSAHKILPAMTMGSYLHINSKAVSIEKVTRYLSMLQSSSPSYPIMATLDISRHFLAHFTTADIMHTIEERNKFIKKLKKISEIKIKQKQDPLKISLTHKKMSGYQLQTILESVGIYPELADPYQVLLIWPLLKKGQRYPFEEIVICLQNTLAVTTVDQSTCMQSFIEDKIKSHPITVLAYSYDEMEQKNIEWIDINEAEKRIAAKMIIPYPPGIPLLMTGEKISKKHIDQLNYLRQLNARFQENHPLFQEGKIAVFTK